jgi:hypothetical protein
MFLAGYRASRELRNITNMPIPHWVTFVSISDGSYCCKLCNWSVHRLHFEEAEDDFDTQEGSLSKVSSDARTHLAAFRTHFQIHLGV